MAIVTGCMYGLAARGGKPKQCAKTIVATITINPDDTQSSRRSMTVCQDHYSQIADRQAGTIYREMNGQPLAVRFHLVSL